MARNGKKRRVIITRADDTEHSYESQCEAALAEGIRQPYISMMCLTGRTIGGFSARFIDDRLNTEKASRHGAGTTEEGQW